MVAAHVVTGGPGDKADIHLGDELVSIGTFRIQNAKGEWRWLEASTRRFQDKSGNDEARDAENATSEPKGHELVYAARVSLDHEQMQVDDRLVNLSPGMAVTVEIKTGTRRIISYLLSPLARYTHDSLRER